MKAKIRIKGEYFESQVVVMEHNVSVYIGRNGALVMDMLQKTKGKYEEGCLICGFNQVEYLELMGE